MVLQVATNVAHYASSNRIQVYELDESQKTVIWIDISDRLNSLDVQWRCLGKTQHIYLSVIGLCFFLFKLTSSFGIQIIKNTTEATRFQRIRSCIEYVLTMLDKGIDQMSSHANLLLDSVSMASYVAMIALGFPIAGVIGLLGLCVIAVKRSKKMPESVDKALKPLVKVSNIIVSLATPQLVIRWLFVINAIIEFISYISDLSCFSSGFDSTIRQHTIKARVDENWRDRINGQFKVNYSSLHAKELEDLFSEEDERELSQWDAQRLYDQLEEKIHQNEIKMNWDGWNNIKEAILTGRVIGPRSNQFDQEQKILKLILINILKNEGEEFQKKVVEFADIGISCPEGWLRDINYMLQPKMKDNFAWVIHHHLAVWRGELIKESLIQENIRWNRMTEGRISLESVGGPTNVHLVNQVQCALWHKWRTYEAERVIHAEGRSLFTKWIQKGARAELATKLKSRQDVVRDLFCTYSYIALPVLVPKHQLVNRIEAHLCRKYQVIHIKKAIEEAILPKYEDGQSFREIPWESITKWLSSLLERGFITDDGAGIIEVDDKRRPYLNHNGVLLLLWDLGIIEPV